MKNIIRRDRVIRYEGIMGRSIKDAIKDAITLAQRETNDLYDVRVDLEFNEVILEIYAWNDYGKVIDEYYLKLNKVYKRIHEK